MKTNKILTLFILINFFFSTISIGQVPTNPSPASNVTIPPAPNAAALGKYGSIPVNNYTGLPSVSIPIYTIKQGELQLPLSLSYHAAVKVDDIESWVGLGWALNAGGVITCAIKGLPDRGNEGYWANIAMQEPTYNFTQYQLEKITKGEKDLEPDSYFYNFAGNTGSLIFINEFEAISVSDRGISFKFLYSQNNEFTGIQVIDKDGIRYLFGKDYESRDQTTSETIGELTKTSFFTSSYYLNSIISANSQDTIRFSYINEEIHQSSSPQESNYIFVSTDYPEGHHGYHQSTPNGSVTYSSQVIQQKRLETIRWSQGTITFKTAEKPVDQVGVGSLLHTIQIHTSQKQERMQFIFSYDKELGGRTQLMALQKSSDGISQPPHKFFYYSHQAIPAANSYQQDHWGFANLNPSQTLLPEYIIENETLKHYPEGGNRDPDFASSLAGILRKIQYPTGGSTKLYYEPHTISRIKNSTAKEIRKSSYEVHKFRSSESANKQESIIQTETFAITKPTLATVRLETNLSGITDHEGAIYAQISNGTSVLFSCSSGGSNNRCNEKYERVLNPGTYTLEIGGTVEINTTYGLSASCVLQEVVDATTDVLVGGQRIRRLVDVSAEGRADSVVKVFSYTLPSSDGMSNATGVPTSSGVLVGSPHYYAPYTVYVAVDLSGESLGGIPVWYKVTERYSTISSTSRNVLGNTQGSHVGYTHVQIAELVGNEPQGTTLYSYSGPDVYRDVSSNMIPLLINSQEYRRGKLLEQRVYHANGSLLERVHNSYRVDKRAEYSIKGTMIFSNCSVPEQFENDITQYIPISYYNRTQWEYLHQTTTTRYRMGDTLQQFVQRQTMLYGNDAHGLVTQIRTQTTGDATHIRYLRYPSDIAVTGSDAASIGVLRLQQQHRWSPVIDDTQWKKKTANDSVLVSSLVHLYRPIGSSQVVEEGVYTWQSATPATTYSPLTLGVAGWTQDHRYKQKVAYRKYDPFFRPTEVVENQKDVQSYIWRGRQQELIATIQHASSEQVAYTGFESKDLGRWQLASGTGISTTTTAYTGLISYQLQAGQLKCANLPAGTYQLSFWQPSSETSSWIVNGQIQSPYVVGTAKGWRNYQFRITLPTGGDISLSGTGLIDDLRVHPAGAQMTTYTHDPLVGITSQTGPDGRVLQYEYDALGRLQRVRDEEDRILTEQEYHYATRP